MLLAIRITCGCRAGIPTRCGAQRKFNPASEQDTLGCVAKRRTMKLKGWHGSFEKNRRKTWRNSMGYGLWGLGKQETYGQYQGDKNVASWKTLKIAKVFCGMLLYNFVYILLFRGDIEVTSTYHLIRRVPVTRLMPKKAPCCFPWRDSQFSGTSEYFSEVALSSLNICHHWASSGVE